MYAQRKIIKRTPHFIYFLDKRKKVPWIAVIHLLNSFMHRNDGETRLSTSMCLTYASVNSDHLDILK